MSLTWSLSVKFSEQFYFLSQISGHYFKFGEFSRDFQIDGNQVSFKSCRQKDIEPLLLEDGVINVLDKF